MKDWEEKFNSTFDYIETLLEDDPDTIAEFNKVRKLLKLGLQENGLTIETKWTLKEMLHDFAMGDQCAQCESGFYNYLANNFISKERANALIEEDFKKWLKIYTGEYPIRNLHSDYIGDGQIVRIDPIVLLDRIEKLIKKTKKEVEKENLENTVSELLKDIPNLALIWGDGSGKDEDMVENSKAFGLQLVFRFQNKHSK